MRKLLVSDYDGTFYINDEDIRMNIDKVEEYRQKGNIFVIATGRSYGDFNRKLEQYPMEYDYLVINQGATILNEKGEIIKSYVIEEKVKEQLIKELDLHDQDKMFSCSVLESRVSINHTEISKIHVEYETIEKAAEINKRLNKKYKGKIISYLIPRHNSVEIISAKTNKAKAVEMISDLLNIKKENIFVIGDSYNDIEMIDMFNGYCIKDSVDEVKDVSISECKSVSQLIDKILE